MSLPNNELMSAMFSRATTISFDPMVQHQRAQFNSSTGSWVFGLAAFAAGVALKKMIQPAGDASLASKVSTPVIGGRSNGSMKALLRDTMAEEGRSGDFLSSISSEVAKLREEVASLSAQREQLKSPASVQSDYVRSADEYNQVKETLEQLNAEKARLAKTEAELQQVLMTQRVSTSGATDAIYSDLEKVQHDLDNLKQEQERIQGEYQLSQKRAQEARSAMDSLKQMLDEKVERLKEAEFREENLVREHEILIETVANLKKQLNFFREQAKQDQSGVTSLKILEESNSRLSAQVDSSQHEAEQQQAALIRLAAEKSDLAQQLDEYRKQARESEKMMQRLETVLADARSAEQALLAQVDALSKKSLEADDARIERMKLENDLADARLSIEALSANEDALNKKLAMLASQGVVLTSDNEELLRVKAERDGLHQSLMNLERRSGDSISELEGASLKEEELNQRIETLLGQIKKLENERDFEKSRSDLSALKASNNSYEFDALKQSITTLEGEKNALSAELQVYQREASEAIKKQKAAEHLVRDSENKERRYRDEIATINSKLQAIEDSKVGFSQQQLELQKAEAEIQQLLAGRKENERELDQVTAELNQVKSQLSALNEQCARLTNDEQNSLGRVAQIEDQLRERDHLIADAKIKEDNLRSEVVVLQQTTHQLHGELERLRGIQSGQGIANASLSVLQETENQLKEQLQYAQRQIEEQHQNLISAEQEKVQLEVGYREESAKLASLQNENNFLREQLSGWEAKEAEQATKLLQLGGGAGGQDVRGLEQELERLRGQQLGIKAQLDSSVNEKVQLEQNLNDLNGKLHEVVAERDQLSIELKNVSVTLGSITAERDDLRSTCSRLQASIQELEAQQNKKDSAHKQALLAMEACSIPEEVMKLELPKGEVDVGGFNLIGKLPEKQGVQLPSLAQFSTKKLDVAGFDPSEVKGQEFESVTSNNLFESNKIGRFRKFKGHRKTEDIEAKEKDLEDRVQAYKERLEKGESEEDIALSMTKEETSTESEADEKAKQKAYSPNRSFMDLLDDSERRKVEQKQVDVETTWTEVEELEGEDIVLEEESNYKPLLFGGMAAGIGIVATTMFLFNQSNDSSDPNKGKQTTNNQQQNPGANGNYTGPDADIGHINGDIDLSSVELKKQALDLLKKFHDSPDPNVKASLCRVPKRTLIDM